jgi:hypothetical protein
MACKGSKLCNRLKINYIQVSYLISLTLVLVI